MPIIRRSIEVEREAEVYECPECGQDITEDLIDEGLLDPEDLEGYEEEED